MSFGSTGGVNYPVTKLHDPNEGATGAYGVDSAPMRTRNRDRGTADFDPGLVVLPSVETELTPVTVYRKLIYLHNITTNVQRVNIKNTAGVFLIKDYDMAPREIMSLPGHGAAIVGIRWWSDNAASVVGQIVGTQ
jgi:tRNA pseudouridine-54 N-methylase